MPDGGASENDPFADWLRRARDLFASADRPDDLWSACEGLFEEWRAVAESIAGQDGARAFDPGLWTSAGIDPEMDAWWAAGPADPVSEALTATGEWLAWSAAMERLRAAVAPAWFAAFRRFCEIAAEGHAPVGDWAALTRLWADLAERELASARRSDAWLSAQRDLVRAGAALRDHARRTVEQIAKPFGLPTRSELDRIHDALAEMRTEQRRLRRDLAEARAEIARLRSRP